MSDNFSNFLVLNFTITVLLQKWNYIAKLVTLQHLYRLRNMFAISNEKYSVLSWNIDKYRSGSRRKRSHYRTVHSDRFSVCWEHHSAEGVSRSVLLDTSFAASRSYLRYLTLRSFAIPGRFSGEIVSSLFGNASSFSLSAARDWYSYWVFHVIKHSDLFCRAWLRTPWDSAADDWCSCVCELEKPDCFSRHREISNSMEHIEIYKTFLV